MKRFVLIFIVVMGIAFVATINVKLNSQEKNDKFSLFTLSQLNATATPGETENVICHVSRVCKKTVYEKGQWIEKENGLVECWGYTPGQSCTRTDTSVTCDGVTHSCN
jgi:hypothetical protein